MGKNFASKINSSSPNHWRSYCHQLVKDLPTKKNSSCSHTIYHLIVEAGEQINCCKECFMKFYNLSDYMLKKFKSTDIEDDINYRWESTEKAIRLNGREYVNLLSTNGVLETDFHTESLPVSFSPDDRDSELCVAWMMNNFYTFGDSDPNGRILYTAEDCKKEYYDMYCNSEYINDPVTIDKFGGIWNNCFPYVITRDDENQVGKCHYYLFLLFNQK